MKKLLFTALIALTLISCKEPENNRQNACLFPDYLARIECYDVRADQGFVGSGILTDGNYFITSNHLFSGIQKKDWSYICLDIYFENGQVCYADFNDIILKDRVNDIAIIKLKLQFQGKFAKLKENFKIGEEVAALGYPESKAEKQRGYILWTGKNNSIGHNAKVKHGYSGGPLINAKNEVVGINISLDRFNTAWATNSKILINYLKKLKGP